MGDRSWSWADIQAAHANTRSTAVIAQDTAAAVEVAQLLDRYVRLREEDATGLVDHAEELTALKDRIGALRKQIEASEVTFVFEGVGRSRYNKLRAEHPAPKGQPADELYGDNPGFNVETFAPAMMAEACVEPKDLAGNLAAWTTIHDTWNTGPLALLWTKCLAAQQAVNAAPKADAVSAFLKGSSTETS